MTTLAITTVCREVPTEAPYGYVTTVDLERWEVTGRCPMVKPKWYREDNNPRGGSRGAKGLVFTDTHAWIANFSAAYRFDSSWRLEAVASHPSCAAIHDLAVHGGYLWLCSTSNNRVMQFDESGALVGQVEPLSFEPVCRAFPPQRRDRNHSSRHLGQFDFREPHAYRLEDHDELHLNSLCFLADGSMLVLFGMCWTRSQIASFALKEWLRKRGCWEPIVAVNRVLVRLLRRKTPIDTQMIARPATGRGGVVCFQPEGDARVVLTLDDLGVPVHSLLPEADGSVLFADTSSGSLVRFCPERGTILARSKVTDGFLRGLHRVDPETLLAGDQNRLLLLRPQPGGTEAEERLLCISDDRRETIFDIKTVPLGFAPLPPDLFAGAPAF